MVDSITEELRSFGVTSNDFNEKKGVLTNTMCTEVDEKEIFFSLFQNLATKATNYQILQMLYWNMDLYKDKLGQDSFEFQQNSHQSRLLDLKQNGKTRVKINASGCSSSCMKLHNLVLPISKALRNLPIPNPDSESTLFSVNIWCISIYLAAKESDVEAVKLPAAVESILELPKLADVVKTHERDPTAESEQKKFKQVEDNTLALILSVSTLSFGAGMSFFSPIAGGLLGLWSIPFFSPLIIRWPRLLSFVKYSWESWALIGIGFLLALLILMETPLVERKINTFTKNSTITSYQVLLIEDHSSSTRSRIQVRIIVPEARTARERARVLMNAAREILASLLSNDPKNPQYEYISVILEASKKTAGQGYAIAEVEFAPGGKDSKG